MSTTFFHRISLHRRSPIFRRKSGRTVGRTVKTETRNNYFGEILSWLIPIILLVVIWMVIFRRMSAGAGGAAGSIFNVGKSRAQIFDKNTNVKI